MRFRTVPCLIILLSTISSLKGYSYKNFRSRQNNQQQQRPTGNQAPGRAELQPVPMPRDMPVGEWENTRDVRENQPNRRQFSTPSNFVPNTRRVPSTNAQGAGSSRGHAQGAGSSRGPTPRNEYYWTPATRVEQRGSTASSSRNAGALAAQPSEAGGRRGGQGPPRSPISVHGSIDEYPDSPASDDGRNVCPMCRRNKANTQLSCGDVFCLKCTKNLGMTQPRWPRRPERRDFACPICRQNVTGWRRHRP